MAWSAPGNTMGKSPPEAKGAWRSQHRDLTCALRNGRSATRVTSILAMFGVPETKLYLDVVSSPFWVNWRRSWCMAHCPSRPQWRALGSMAAGCAGRPEWPVAAYLPDRLIGRSQHADRLRSLRGSGPLKSFGHGCSARLSH